MTKPYHNVIHFIKKQDTAKEFTDNSSFALVADKKVEHDSYDAFNCAFLESQKSNLKLLYCSNPLILRVGFLTIEQQETDPPKNYIVWHLLRLSAYKDRKNQDK